MKNVPTLESLYTTIPEQGLGQPNKAPKPPALKRLLDAIHGAYEDLGISRSDRETLCPGLTEQGGVFQVSSGTPGFSGSREVHVLAASPSSDRVLEGDLISRLGLVQPSFQIVAPEHPRPRTIGVTRKGWEHLTDFILENTAAGLFEPIEKRRLLTPTLSLADRLLRQ